VLRELFSYLADRGAGELLRDGVDLLITYYLIYSVALILKGTRALQIGLALGLIGVLYVVAKWLQLSTVFEILGAVLSSALLIIVVVFQHDIRRGLIRVGSGAWFGSARYQESRVIDEVIDAATELARHRTGAIIAFEQDANLDEFVGSNKGLEIDAAVTSPLLVSLFVPEAMNKLHDGAVIIRDLRIAKAGVFFPMTQSRVVDASFGSRHRAALGITEETDAVLVVVSEERGSISFCFNGNIIPNLDGPRLRAALDGVFAKRSRSKQPPRRQSLGELLREGGFGRLFTPLFTPLTPRVTKKPESEAPPPSVRIHASPRRGSSPDIPPPGAVPSAAPLRKTAGGASPSVPPAERESSERSDSNIAPPIVREEST
jgi:diadenylate cyclase